MSAMQESSVKQVLLPMPEGLASMHFSHMQAKDVAEVQVIAGHIFPRPWTQSNFVDALNSGGDGGVLRDASDELAGYFLMMSSIDEAHLLSIVVRSDLQGRGIGGVLLDKVVSLAHKKGMASILQVCRVSNKRGIAMYRRYGFSQTGCLKNYYSSKMRGAKTQWSCDYL